MITSTASERKITMNDVIETIAQEMSLPYWWVEAVAIEYTDCRDFADRDEIWTFNFDRLTKNILDNAIRQHKVVVNGIIWHNVHKDVFRSRLIERLVSNVPVPLGSDAIAEGLISDYHFHFSSNPIDVWDPKLDFSAYFQVFDQDKLWQWHIADFVSIEGRKFGKWISSEVDLEPLDQIHDKLSSLRNPVIKPLEPGHAEFKSKVQDFYRWLGEIRQPILHALEDIHCAKRSALAASSKVTKVIPPVLSRFETFNVQNGEIYTKFFAAPIFYRASRLHATRAEQLANAAHSDGELVAKLDEIYEERATAIILGSACLEAFINSLGFEHFADVWSQIEQLPLKAKWQLFLVLKGKGNIFKSDLQPYQFLIELGKTRNCLVHYKTDYQRLKSFGNKFVTHAEYYDVPRKLSQDLLVRLPQLIEELCEATSISKPQWLKPQPGWLQ